MIEVGISLYAILTLTLLIVRFDRGLLLLLPLMPIANHTYHSPITGLNTVNLLIYTAFGMGLIRRMSQRHEGLPPVTIPLVSFFILTLVAWVVGVINYGSEPDFDALRWFINIERWVVYTLLYFAFYFGWSGRYPVQTAFRWMFVGVFIAAAWNIVEIIHPSEYYLYEGRAGGIFTQANNNGIFLASYGFLALALAQATRKRIGKWFYYGSFLLCIQGILLSVSRTAMISFMVASLVYAGYRSRRTFVALLVFLAMLVPTYSFILPDKVVERIDLTGSGSRYEGVAGKLEGSAANRYVQNIAGLRLFMDRPILGHGLGGFYYNSPAYLPANAPDNARSAHTTFLWILVEMGIAALGFFLWFLWSIVREGKRMYESNAAESERALGLFLIVSIVAKCVANTVSTDFLTGDVSSYLWITGALIVWRNHHGTQPGPVRQGESAPVLRTWRPRRRTPVEPGADHA